MSVCLAKRLAWWPLTSVDKVKEVKVQRPGGRTNRRDTGPTCSTTYIAWWTRFTASCEADRSVVECEVSCACEC